MSILKQELITEANTEQAVLEKFINVPGLQHLAENIFLNLKYQDLEAYRKVNRSFQCFLVQLMENPLFWLEKFIRGGMSKQNQKDWLEIIQMTRDTKVGEVILMYFKLNFKIGRLVDFDVPCYIKKDNLEKYSEIIVKLEKETVSIDIWKSKHYRQPLHNVSQDYYSDEIVKSLYNFVNNPEDEDRPATLIYWAAKNGHTDIVQILAPLTDDPNSEVDIECPFNSPPIHEAARNGHSEIVKLLCPLTDDPNSSSNTDESTPIHEVATEGHIEIVKYLAPLTDNPNSPDINGTTPSSITRIAEIRRFLETFNNSKKRKIRSSTKPSKKRAKKN